LDGWRRGGVIKILGEQKLKLANIEKKSQGNKELK
jgi:hypothetical protein